MPELREAPLLESIARRSLPWPPGVITGPGDDMAMLELSGRLLLVAVDQVVEGRHFVTGTDPDRIAHKALARNLSDVAAMAAKPVATLAACTLPAEWTNAQAEALFDSTRRIALERECPLVGGDIAVHRRGAPLVLAVTILAEPWPEALAIAADGDRSGCIAHRGRGRDGDGVFVTGSLGGSWRSDGGGRHLRFEPRVHEARSLLAAIGADRLSLIDLSDGLGRDASALVDGRHQVVLDAERLPKSQGCDWRAAIGDGEDYELCFSSPIEPPASLPARAGPPVPVTRVGRVRTRPAADAPSCVVVSEGAELDASTFGWEHRGHGR